MPAARRVFAVRDQGLETARAALVRGFPVGAVMRGIGCATVARRSSNSSRVPTDSVANAVALFSGIEQHAHRGFAVAASAPGFLVIALETLGDAPVRDEAHVLLVDAHAEGGRRHDNVVPGRVGDPFLLARGAIQGGEAGVVGDCADVVGAQARG